MTIIVEDGSIVANANSYAAHTDLADYCDLRGVTLSTTQATREQYLIKAMDYLNLYTGQWKGDRVSEDQELAWPRYGVYVDGQLRASTEIPRELFYGQLALAVAAISNTIMLTRAPSEKGAIIREKVDVIEVAYDNPGSVLPVAADATADALLKVLLARSGLTVVRA